MFQENMLYMQVIIHQRKPYSSHCSERVVECKALKKLTKLVFSHANCKILPVPKTNSQSVLSFFVRKCLQNRISGLI